MTPAERILREARRDIGMVEATGNNDGAPAAAFMRDDRLPWCAAAVWTWHTRAGVKVPGGYYRNRNVSQFEANCQAVSKWFPPTWSPLPGDCVFFEWRGESDDGPGGRHMGIVEHVDALGCYVHTIEGNLGNAVKRAKRSLDSGFISGYARLW